MANKKISDLNAATEIQGTDEFEIESGGSSYKVDFSVFNLIYAASADYTVTDSDGYRHIHVTTGATDRTITLPTAADNDQRVLTIKKVDSGAGKITIDGEGSETIDGYTSVDFEVQYSGLEIICDGTEWHVLGAIGCDLLEISGALESVYTKVFTGTTDNDGSTSVAHGVGDYDKIFTVSVILKKSGENAYYCGEFFLSSSANDAYWFSFDATNVLINSVGSNMQGQNYRIEVKYWV